MNFLNCQRGTQKKSPSIVSTFGWRCGSPPLHFPFSLHLFPSALSNALAMIISSSLMGHDATNKTLTSAGHGDGGSVDLAEGRRHNAHGGVDLGDHLGGRRGRGEEDDEQGETRVEKKRPRSKRRRRCQGGKKGFMHRLCFSPFLR